MDKKNFILVVILCFLVSSYSFIVAHSRYQDDIEYYKEKSQREQRLLWRISYTFPEKWELIKNTPEYHQCIQYDIETLQ